MSSEQTLDEGEVSADGGDNETRITMEMLHAVDGRRACHNVVWRRA